MPLSKARNRERMKRIRLHALLLPPQKSKSVQPKWTSTSGFAKTSIQCVDADGNVIPEY